MRHGILRIKGESGERYEFLPTGTVKRDGRPVGTISLESYSFLAARLADARRKRLPVSITWNEGKG